MEDGIVVRLINPTSLDEILLVAGRMRDTLVEVLGEERGGSMYSMEWLEQRVRFHLDPRGCTGEVFVAEIDSGHIAGHAIVRKKSNEAGEAHGLFSTIYVEPPARGKGIASALVAT